MNITYCLGLYLLLAILVVGRMTWLAYRHADTFDWKANGTDIKWQISILGLMWPLLILRHRVLVEPSIILSDSLGRAAALREEAAIRANLPVCGRELSFRQHEDRYGVAVYGEFSLPASEVERWLKVHIIKHPHLMRWDHGEFLAWVRARDESINRPVEVPRIWPCMLDVTSALIRAGVGTVYCSICCQRYPTGALITKDDSSDPGWNFDRLRCQAGHFLLVVPTIHVFSGPIPTSKD